MFFHLISHSHGQNWLGAGLAVLIFIMLSYFALSIVNHLAQKHKKRLDDEMFVTLPRLMLTAQHRQ
jgi:hypothetical protein